MSSTFGPERWAIEISKVLNLVLGTDHFPVNVAEVAREYSSQRFPGDAITLIKGANLPRFDGALFPAPAGRSGWGIIYNDAIASAGRINFTLGHEFGHYLLHRLVYPQGIQCSAQDVVRWDSAYGQIESQANRFAAGLLMPLDDFRRQIPDTDAIDLERISVCAERYRVSLVAAILRWLGYTRRRAILVVSRDGFIMWARSSDAALKSGLYFRTSRGPIEVPAASLVAQGQSGRNGAVLAPGVWFAEEAQEFVAFSEQYDFAISLLLLDQRSEPSLTSQRGDRLFDEVGSR